MCVGGASLGASAGSAIDQRRGVDRRPRPVVTPSTRASAICASVTACLRLDEPRLRRGALRVGPRGFGPGPQLVVDQGVDRARQEIAAIDIGLQRRHRALGADDVEECGADGGLDVEPRQCFVGPRTGHRGFGAGDGGADEGRSRTAPTRTARPSRFPRRCRRTPTAAPDRTSPESPTAAAPGRRCCWPCRGSICQSESSLGRYADFATLTPARRCVDLLERRTHRRIVIDGVLQRLLQRQTHRRQLLAAASALPGLRQRRDTATSRSRASAAIESSEPLHAHHWCSNISPNSSCTRCRPIASAFRPAGVARYTPPVAAAVEGQAGSQVPCRSMPCRMG